MVRQNWRTLINRVTKPSNNNNKNKLATKTTKIQKVSPAPTPLTKAQEAGENDPNQVTFKAWLKKRAKEFCSVTALHGYGHIIREDTAMWERIVWAIVTFSALIAAIILLWLSWIWNAETPTVTVSV